MQSVTYISYTNSIVKSLMIFHKSNLTCNCCSCKLISPCGIHFVCNSTCFENRPGYLNQSGIRAWNNLNKLSCTWCARKLTVLFLKMIELCRLIWLVFHYSMIFKVRTQQFLVYGNQFCREVPAKVFFRILLYLDDTSNYGLYK